MTEIMDSIVRFVYKLLCKHWSMTVGRATMDSLDSRYPWIVVVRICILGIIAIEQSLIYQIYRHATEFKDSSQLEAL